MEAVSRSLIEQASSKVAFYLEAADITTLTDALRSMVPKEPIRLPVNIVLTIHHSDPAKSSLLGALADCIETLIFELGFLQSPKQIVQFHLGKRMCEDNKIEFFILESHYHN